MTTRFDDAFEWILDAEGGYTDDKHDPGGRTRYGITEAVARAHGYKGEPHLLPEDQARAIYQSDYWDACRCDDIPWPLALYVFDAAVNQGANTAIKMLQRALNCTQDGVIGNATLELAAHSNAWHAANFLAIRAMRYTTTSHFEQYGVGWLTRLFTLATHATGAPAA